LTLHIFQIKGVWEHRFINPRYLRILQRAWFYREHVVQLIWLIYYRVANVINWHLQNDLLIAVICWTNSHQNTAAVVVNSIASLGWKSFEMPEKYEVMSCNSRKQVIFYHNTALQPSSVSVPLTKSTGALISLVWLPLQHHLGRISASKNGFSSKIIICKSSSHHSSTKNSHTKYG